MNPETIQRLRDALAAAETIRAKAQGYHEDAYLGDPWFQAAVERNLEMIGEALNRAFRIDPDTLDLLPDGRGWIGLRNILAHAYDHIRPQIIWDTVQQEIPEPIAALEKIPNERAHHATEDGLAND